MTHSHARSSASAELDAATRLGPVIVQTDTVYCLAAPCGTDSADELYAIKGRARQESASDERSPYLPIVVGNTAQLAELGLRLEGPAAAFAQAFWPGPLTLVVEVAANRARPSWLDGRSEVALRIPAFAPLRSLATQVGPLLVTSANRTGDPPATTRAEAEAVFARRYPVFDWPELQSTGVATTILNVRREPPVIQRMGAISPLEIMRVYDRHLVEGSGR